MATRTISTKLAIDGESEYRASLSRINSELKTLQSSLKLVESEYKNNANSLEALKAKGEALDHVYDAQKAKVDLLRTALDNAKSAQDVYAQKSEELRAKIQANAEALEKLRASSQNTTAEEARLSKENEELNAALAENEKYLAAAEKGVNNWQNQLNNAEIKLNNLDAEIQENDKLLDEAKNSADGCAHSIDEFGNEAKETGDAVDALAQALAAAGLAKTAKEIAEGLRECVYSAVAFEAAMAGVKRTVGGGDDFISAIGESFKELSTVMPITTTELAKIAETAGQLGIRQENVEQFTTVMAKLATTTDLTADSAATMLAQFSNITGVTDYERLGAVVASLGDSTATTASKVVEMSQGMAAAASVAGMSERDILAISAAVGSLGIESLAGSTAMATLISTIYKATETGDKLEDFASVAGMSAQAFKESWGTNAVGTLDAFIRGLSDTERNGRSAIVLLDDLGIKNVRQTKAILGLSEAGDLLTRTIAQANQAWEANAALNEKAAIMYETTDSKIKMYKNSVDNLKIAVGDQLTPALGDLAEKGTDVASWATKMVQENEWLAPAITVTTTAVIGFTGALGASIAVIKAVELAQTALNTALLSNPFTLVATAAVTLTAALIALAATMPDTQSEYDKLSASSKQQYDEIQKLNAEYERACKLYGESSEEAQKLSGQIKAETELFERNKKTIAEVSTQTEELIDRNRQLRESCTQAADSIEAQRLSSEYLVGKLQELMGEEEKTEGTKQRILAIVEALNQEIPSLGLAYDSYSDSLNLTKERLLALVDAEIEQRQQVADKERLIELETLQAQNTAQLVTVRENLAAAEERLAEAIRERDAELDKHSDAERLAMAYNVGDAVDTVVDAVIAAQNEVDSLREAEQALTAAMEENAAEAQALSGKYANAADAAASAEERAAQRIRGSLQELAQSYAEAYEEAGKSLDAQIGKWQKLDNTAVTSTATLQESVESQAVYLRNYASNLESLLGRSIEGIADFARNFTDGSAESAAALAGLAIASDEEIRNIMASMEQVGSYKESLKNIFAALETDLTGSLTSIKEQYVSTIEEISGTGADVDFSAFTAAVESAFGDIGAKFETIGTEAGAGMSKGVEDSTDEVAAAGNKMGQAVLDAVREVLDSHSPSIAMEGIGKDADDGLAQGIDKNAETVTQSADDLGEKLTERMKEAGHRAEKGFMDEFNAVTEDVNRTMEDVRSAVEEYGPVLSDSGRQVGEQMIDGMAEGVYNEAGYLYGAVSEVVNNAIEAARWAADTHSPSKKTEDIFEDVGEGMIVGVEKKKQRVAEATQSVVDEALKVDTSGLVEEIRRMSMNVPDVSKLLRPADSVATFNARQTSPRKSDSSWESGSSTDLSTVESLLRKVVTEIADMRVKSRM